MSPPTKLREIERLRAVAVLMVMVVHWDSLSHLLPEIARWSWSGVDLFFVISGYVVSLALLRALPPLGEAGSFREALGQARAALGAFYVRRFFRILPAALAVMLVGRLVVGILPLQFGSPLEWDREVVTFLGGVYNYAYPFADVTNRFGPYWSLSVEEHFYLLLPIVFVVCRTPSRRLAACLVFALFSVFARGLAPPEGAAGIFYWRFSSHLRFDSLMAGVALALISGGPAAKPMMPPGLMRWVVLPCVLAVVACLPGAAPEYVRYHEGLLALAMLSGLLVFYASLDRGYVLPVPGLGRALEFLGSRSYALYLVHQPLSRVDEGVRPFWPAYDRLVPRDADTLPWRRALVLFVAALLVAEVLHRCVERPFMRLGRRVLEGPAPLRPSRRTLAALACGAVLFALFAFRHPLMLALGPPNLARGAPVRASSHWPGKPEPAALTNGVLEGEAGLHTNDEDKPWATVDLGRPIDIGAIRVYNRDDGFADASLPLEVLVSDDDVHYTVIARRETVFTQEWPWRIKGKDLRARYVRFEVDRRAALCLSEVEVFSSTALATLP